MLPMCKEKVFTVMLLERRGLFLDSLYYQSILILTECQQQNKKLGIFCPELLRSRYEYSTSKQLEPSTREIGPTCYIILGDYRKHFSLLCYHVHLFISERCCAANFFTLKLILMLHFVQMNHLLCSWLILLERLHQILMKNQIRGSCSLHLSYCLVLNIQKMLCQLREFCH
jgi:hypothetical protein